MKKLILISCLLLCSIVDYGQNLLINRVERGKWCSAVEVRPKYEVILARDTIYVIFDSQLIWKIAYRDTLFTICGDKMDTITKDGNMLELRYRAGQFK